MLVSLDREYRIILGLFIGLPAIASIVIALIRFVTHALQHYHHILPFSLR